MQNEIIEMIDQENVANDFNDEVGSESAEAVFEATAGEVTGEQDEASCDEPNSFEKMGLDKKLLRAIEDMGFDSATPIQEKAIPIELSGRDMIG